MQNDDPTYWRKIGSDIWHIPGCVEGPEDMLHAISICGENIVPTLCPSCSRHTTR